MLESFLTQTATKLNVTRDASGDLVHVPAGDTTLSCMFRSITPFQQQNHMEYAGFQGMAWFGPTATVKAGDTFIMPDGVYYRASNVTLAERRLGESGTTQFVKVMLSSLKPLVS